MTASTSGPAYRLRAVAAADIARLAALNDAAVPAVNALGPDGLRAHLPDCAVALVAEGGDGAPAGLVLAVAPGAAYTSENYRWFQTHRPASLYVDRIVVAPLHRGRGIGRALHEAVRRHALTLGLAEVTCEVNLDPPNPGSIAFHTHLGFAKVGELDTKEGSVRVALMARPVR